MGDTVGDTVAALRDELFGSPMEHNGLPAMGRLVDE
jgi:hypothetical protein